MVNLDLYRVFYTVAKCGSLTHAAEELYISQPAVSRSIKQLETQLGVPLFTRTHRGMQLSAQGGEMIFEEVERALNLLSDAENRISEMQTSATGRIRIGASDTIFQYMLADRIVDFHARFPAVKIDLLSGVTPETIEQLKTDKCDVAFVNLPITPDAELKLYGNCMRLNDVFVAGNAYAQDKEKTFSFTELQNLILMEKNTVFRKSLDNFFQSHGVDVRPAIEVGSWELMKRLVISGMGIGVIPKEYVLNELASGKLIEIKTDVPLPVRSVGMLLKKHTPVPYALHCFIDDFRREN